MTFTPSLETQLLLRTDRALGRSRTGKTRKKPNCTPGNKVCGSRCIPVEWDCREKGQGYDNHLKAKQTDLLGGAANIERGARKVARGVLTGSPSTLESGRRALVRGVVKITPGTLAEKREREKELVRRSHLIAGGLAVIALGLTSHNILKNRWPGYQQRFGDAIENSLRDGYSDARDQIPFIRARRLAVRAEASQAARAAATAARYTTITDPSFLKSRISTNARSLAGNRIANRDLNAVSKALQQADTSFTATPDFDSWNTRSRSGFFGARRGGGSDRTPNTTPGSAFSDTATERYLSRQYGFDPQQRPNPGAHRGRPRTALGNTEARQTALRAHMAQSMRSQSRALQTDATNRGYNINSKFLSPIQRQQARESYLDRIMRENHAGMPDDVATLTRNNLRTLLTTSDRTTFQGLAAKQWRETQQNFDNYYSELYTYTTSAPGAAAPNPASRNRIPASARDVLAHADVGHAAALASRLPSGSIIRRTPVRGLSHASLVKRHYYHTRVAGTTASTYTITPNLAITAAQELTGRSDISRLEAYRLLREDFGFTNLSPPSPPRTTRTRSPRRGDALSTIKRSAVTGGTGRGKKCGNSFIPRNHKCNPQDTPSAGNTNNVKPGTKSAAPKTTEAIKRTEAKTAVAVGGVAAVGLTAAAILAHKRVPLGIPALSNKALKVMNSAQVTAGLNKLPDFAKEPAKRLTGRAKVAVASMGLSSQGAIVKSVNNKYNFSTWEMPNGTLVSVGSVNDTVLAFKSVSKKPIKNFKSYEMAFTVDEQYTAGKALTSKESREIVVRTKAMFSDHVEKLPDDCFLECTPFKGDEKGDKRASVYEKFGFRAIRGLRTEKIFALKNQGKFTAIPEAQDDYIGTMIRGDSLSIKLDAERLKTRKGKKCGESYIPADHKCGPINGTSTKTKIGVAAALAGGAALAIAAKKYKVGEFHTGVAARSVGAKDLVNPNFRMRRNSYIVKNGKITTTEELIAQVEKLKGTPGVIDANIDTHIAFLRKTRLTAEPGLVDDLIKTGDSKLRPAYEQAKLATDLGAMHGFAPFADKTRIYVRQTRRDLTRVDADPTEVVNTLNKILEDVDSPAKPFFTGSYAKNGDIYETLTTLHESGHQLHLSGGGQINASKLLTRKDIDNAKLVDALERAATKYGATDINSPINARMETFAELYTMYIGAGVKFKKEHPLAYDWVDGIVSDTRTVNRW